MTPADTRPDGQEELRLHVDRDVAAALAELDRLKEPATLASLDAAERVRAARLELDHATATPDPPSAEEAATIARIVAEQGVAV